LAIRTAAIRHGGKGFYADEILEQWTAGDMPDEFVEFFVRQFYVAVVDGIVVGTGSVDLENGKVDGIFVRPDMMGRRIGKRLVALCEELGRRAGLKCLTLQATLNAAPFYRRCGFVGEVIGVYQSPRGFSMDCFPMTKWIGETRSMP
jgi:GNAT superfamily N-acetyltransferase